MVRGESASESLNWSVPEVDPQREEASTYSERVAESRVHRLAALIVAAFVAFGLVAPAAGATSSTTPPFAGRWLFNTYDEESGLTSLSPELLLQDRTGFLWVGTPDGLFRLEGARFRRFGVEDGLPSAKITALHQRPDGRLYVGTRSGLARFEDPGFVALGTQSGLPEGAAVTSLGSDAAGTLYVGTSKGLFLSIAELFGQETSKDAGAERAADKAVTALVVDPAGKLFFGRGGLLNVREKGVVSEVGGSKGLPPLGRIDSLLLDTGGRLWVRSLDHLFSLDPSAARFARQDDGLPPALAWGRVAQDPSGGILVPTSKGLARRVNGSWVLLGRREGLVREAVLTALVDREGSLWLGLPGEGLVRRAGSGAFTVWATPDGLSSETIWSLARERVRGGKSSVWVGTQQGLCRIAEDGKVSVVRGDGTFFALAAAEDGVIWAGAWPGGVTRFAPGAAPKRFGADDLPADQLQIAALHVSRDGDVWAGARTGLYRLRRGGGDRFEKVSLPQAEEPDSFFAFAEDTKGHLFAGGRNGLVLLGGDAPKRFGKRNGLASDFVTSLLSSADGSLVVGYREAPGLDRVSLEGDRALISSVTLASKGHENPVLRVSFLGRDAAGALWVGGPNGVLVYRGEGGEPTHYGRDDGLAANETSLNAFLADPDGSVLFGTARGLVRWQPGARVVHPLPAVAFTGAWVGGRRVAASRPLTLRPDERDLRVSWAGLTAHEAAAFRFRYRVGGLQKAFTETSASDLHLTALPAGRYTLELVALDPSGKEGPKPATLDVDVEPTFLESWWGRGILFLLLVAAFFATARFTTTTLRSERAALRELVESQRSEIETQQRELEEASLTDTLTQVRNRRFFFATIEGDVERSMRAHGPVATPAERRTGDLIFYLVELDCLGDVNAHHGTAGGDNLLTDAVRRLKTIVRSSDFLIRWSGSRFLVVSRSGLRDQGLILAQRMLAVLGTEPLALPDDKGIVRSTASIGWAPFPWYVGAPWEVLYEDVVRLAEKALDLACERGGNRAVGVLARSAQKGPADEENSPFTKPLQEASSSSVELVEWEGSRPDAVVAPPTA